MNGVDQDALVNELFQAGAALRQKAPGAAKKFAELFQIYSHTGHEGDRAAQRKAWDELPPEEARRWASAYQDLLAHDPTALSQQIQEGCGLLPAVQPI